LEEPKHRKSAIGVVKANIELKLLLGLRQGDMLRLKESDLKEDGIHVTPRKTKGSTTVAMIYK